MRPPMSQAAKTRVAEPTALAMSLVTRKMPVPMVSPMTIATADQRPRPRIKSDDGERPAESGPFVIMEVRRAYYRRWGWSTGLSPHHGHNVLREVARRKEAC